MSIYNFDIVMIKSNLTGRRNQDTERKSKVTFRKGVNFMKKVKFLAVALALTVAMAIPSFAVVWGSFSAIIPGYQVDKEVSTISRTKASNTSQNFLVQLNVMPEGFTKLRAWTETGAGVNASSPYNTISEGQTTRTNYTTTPSPGTRVTLNLDNPIYSESTASAAGSWTPN